MGVKRRAGKPASPPAATLDTRFVRTGACTFAGHVLDRGHPERVFAVELLVDGRPVAVATADRYTPELAGCGDGCYGFGFRLDEPPAPDSRVEARLANLGEAVGAPVMGRAAPEAAEAPRAECRWLGGLRFSGWLPVSADGREPRLAALVDGAQVAEVRASGWGSGGGDAPGRTFDLFLPERFADGRLHRLSLRDDDGEKLPVGVIPFVADSAGFAALLGGPERARGELLDALLPASFPMARYAEWREHFPPPAAAPSAIALAVVAVGPGNTEATLESLGAQTHGSWLAAVLPPGSGPVDFDPADLRAFLAGEGRDCEVSVFTLAGTRLAPDALARIAAAFAADREAAIVYPDVAVEAADGGLWPLFFPAFDYERLLEQGYCCHLFAMHRGALDRGSARKAGNLYRLFNAVLDGAPSAARIVHLPGEAGILADFDRAAAAEALARANAAHLGRGVRSDPGAGAILPAARLRRSNRGATVDIVVPAMGPAGPIAATVESLRATVPDARILVVAGAGADIALPEGVVRLDGVGRTAHLANLAVANAQSDFVCMCEPGLEPVDGWLEELLSRMHGADAGAVAPMLIDANGGIVEAGIVAGPGLALAPAHADRLQDDPGYADLLLVAHQRSVPGSACVLLRRGDWLAAGGMDAAHFPEHFAVADLCLRLAASGARNIVAPAARVVDRRPGRRHPPPSYLHDAPYERELACLRARWGALLAADPFYSPLLAASGAPFSALAWLPRPTGSRLPAVPPPADLPPGF